MYLIPADIRTKRILRFTVTSQYTTADDVLRDWGIISKMASNLLAETQAPINAKQSNLEDVMEAQENEDLNSDTKSGASEDAAFRMDKAQVELWIDKAWNRSRRPMRSLSCNSEPLPYSYSGPRSGYDFETRPRPKDVAVPLPTSTTEGSGALDKITEMPSNLPGKQVLKKLTKFYSVPSFCNQWVQCGQNQLCCPLKVSHAAQKHLSSSCRRVNCMPSSPKTNTSPSSAPLETNPTLLK